MTKQHPQKIYDDMLDNYLAEAGMTQEYDFYVGGDESSLMPVRHRIVGKIEKTINMFGIKIPYRTKCKIANITSEPKKLGSICGPFSHLKYNGLKVELLNPEFKDKIKKVVNKLEKSLNESVKLTAYVKT